GAGMEVISTVHYGSGFSPYANAYWNGTQIYYYDIFGFPLADDVVGHELSHGVTEHTSNLYYYYQSGAINESFSDVWGEFIDLTNSGGTDTAAVRWLLGEDISGLGAIRDMANPPTYGDPDKMTSSNYHLGDLSDSSFDNGGVHKNSGVNNKAVYLMTDGDSFNGYTVTGIGIAKVSEIYYEVQTNYLTSGANFLDLYYAVSQACTSLVGGSAGITTGDCTQVQKALDAVEMNLNPIANFIQRADICPNENAILSNLFIDDFENNTNKWTLTTTGTAGILPWERENGYATSNEYYLYGINNEVRGTTIAQIKDQVAIPSGEQVYLRFEHAFRFEQGQIDPDTKVYYDGGVLEYQINGGAWQDASTLHDDGLDYNGSISDDADLADPLHPLLGQGAFVADSHGYNSSRYDLSSLAGDNVRFRWRIGTDYAIYALGWILDDVRIYSCEPDPPENPPTNLTASDGTFGSKVALSWDAVGTATSYEVWRHTADESGNATKQASPNGTSYADKTATQGVLYYYWIKACNSGGCSGFSASDDGVRKVTAIFSDGFENSDFSGWSNAVNITSGLIESADFKANALCKLCVKYSSALAGDYLLKVRLLNKKSHYVVDNSPKEETRYRARFYIKLGAILSMTDLNKFNLLQGKMGKKAPFVVQVRKKGAGYQIRAGAKTDGGPMKYTGWTVI
ncbi:MAG: M4 family metallopeptidase, partial [Chloroflexota bacterium]